MKVGVRGVYGCRETGPWKFKKFMSEGRVRKKNRRRELISGLEKICGSENGRSVGKEPLWDLEKF